MLDMPRYLTMLRNAPNNLTRICFAKPTLPQYTGICMVAVAAIASALGPRNYVCGDGGRLTTPFNEALGGPLHQVVLKGICYPLQLHLRPARYRLQSRTEQQEADAVSSFNSNLSELYFHCHWRVRQRTTIACASHVAPIFARTVTCRTAELHLKHCPNAMPSRDLQLQVSWRCTHHVGRLAQLPASKTRCGRPVPCHCLQTRLRA